MTDDADERHDFRADVDVERATGQGRPVAENDPELEGTFQAAVEEGTLRLRRSLPTLLATGLVGGIDLSMARSSRPCPTWRRRRSTSPNCIPRWGRPGRRSPWRSWAAL